VGMAGEWKEIECQKGTVGKLELEFELELEKERERREIGRGVDCGRMKHLRK